MTKVTLHLEGTKEEIATQCQTFLNMMNSGASPAQAAVNAEATPARRGRKPKAEKAPEPEEAEEELEVEETEAEEDFSDEEFEEESEDEDARVDEAELKTLKKALAAFSAKNGKQATIKALIKYGKTSMEVKKKDLPKLLKELAVKK